MARFVLSSVRQWQRDMLPLGNDLRKIETHINDSLNRLQALEETTGLTTPTSASVLDTEFVAGTGLTGGGFLSYGLIEFNVGAGTGITVNADTIELDAAYRGANPTGTVGLSTVNGTATTYLRSDGAPPLSQAIVPTWTGIHTFSAEPVFNAGIDLGTSGVIQTNEPDGAAAIGYDLNDQITRTTGYARQMRQGSQLLEVVSWDGRFSFGYSTTLTPQTGHVLSFLASDGDSPTGAPITVGILGSVSHFDTTETVLKAVGVAGSHATVTATGASYGIASGVRGSIDTPSTFTTGLSAKVGSAVTAGFGNSSLNSIEGAQSGTTAIDQSYGKSAQPDGDWGHLTGFWCDFLQISSTTGINSTRPGIVSSARLPIQYYSGSTSAGTPNGTSCAIYGEDPNTGTALYPAHTYFARIPYPRKTGGTGVHASHLVFEPWPNTSTIRGGGVEGDVYFDDGTNYRDGLWEYAAGAWHKLLQTQAVDALGGGAAPTLGTIGGTGPTAAAQAQWLRVVGTNGTTYWIPAWT